VLYTTQKTVDIQILIIDNNHNFTNIFAKLLKIKGFSVIVKTTFKTGLQYLKHNSCHVVFVDIPLPDYDEKQILNLLNENAIFKKLTGFLFSSIDLNTAELDDWKKCGLYMYLKKPVKRDVLLKALNDVRTQINSLASQTLYDFTEPYEEEATPEQLEKLNHLQKQIEKLEHFHPVSIQEHPLPRKIEHISKESILAIPPAMDYSTLKNIISNFKYNSEHPEYHLTNSSIENNPKDKEIIKKEIGQIQSEISILKNKIALLNNMGSQESQYGQTSLMDKKTQNK